MSIARAFTTKRAKRDPDVPQRSLTTKQSLAGGSIRDKISSPVGLISTTNMLSYNAPDIHPSPSSSRSSNSTSDLSDSDHKSISSASTPPSSPDTDKGTAEPNHLSCYFNGQTTSGLSTTKSTPDLKGDAAPPTIPTRAPSHTKRSHESLSLSHKKSMSKASLNHKSSAPAIGMGHKASSSGLRSSLQMFSALHHAANNPQAPQPQAPPATQHTKQPSISMDTNLQSEAPARVRPAPMQGLPTRPNQQTPSIARSRSTSRSRSQEQTQNQHAASPHPFGNELAQVTELAEEYSGGKVDFTDEESALMARKGLHKYAAEDYMKEIQGLLVKTYGQIREKNVVNTAVWI